MMISSQPHSIRMATCWVALIGALAVQTWAPTENGQAGFARANQMLRHLYRDQMAAKTHEAQTQFIQETKSTIPKVKRLVDGAILEELNGATLPKPETLAQRLNASLSVTGGGQPLVAAVISESALSGPLYIVAYSVPYWATRSLSSLAVYGRKDGRYDLLSAVKDPLPDRTLALARLPSTGRDELTFMAYGIGWGDPHRHLTVVVYAFDGHRLNLLLRRSDLTEGQVRVDGRNIELTFLAIARGPGGPPVPERIETYRLTRSGIVLESSRAGSHGQSVLD